MYRVLLVDDEEIIKIGLRSMICWEEHGFEIIGTAENGEQALKMAKSFVPDVIITDLYMPVMDGFELIKRLKESEIKSEVIVLSNYGDYENVKKAIKLGAEDYILKVSYDQEKFIQLLNHLKNKLQKSEQNNEISKSELAVENTTEKMKAFLLEGGPTLKNCEKNYYQLFLLVLPSHLVKLEDSQYQNVMKKIQLVLEENFNSYPDKDIFVFNKKYYVLIINTYDNTFSSNNTMHIKIQKTLAIYLMVNCSILYENNILGIHLLKEYLRQALQKTDIVFWKSSYYRIGEISFNSIAEIINMPKAVNRYQRYIENPDVERLEYELYNILSNFEQNYVQPKEVKQFMIIVLSNIRVFIYQVYGKDMLPQYESKIEQIENILDLKKLVASWIDELKKVIQIIQENQNISIIDKIKHYIEENKQEKLRVGEIAEHFNFHPNYLSTYFKEHTGVTLINYINQTKMEYAKELLMHKRYRVKEVAVMVGIEDPFYFNKLFKSFYGCPPSKYENSSIKM